MKPLFINLTTIEDKNTFVNVTNCSDIMEHKDFTAIQFIRHSVYVKESISKIKELINEAYSAYDNKIINVNAYCKGE